MEKNINLGADVLEISIYLTQLIKYKDKNIIIQTADKDFSPHWRKGMDYKEVDVMPQPANELRKSIGDMI